MSAPELAPRSEFRGIVAVWVVALLAAIAVTVFATPATRAVWYALAMAGSLVLAMGVQLAYGRPAGFLQRVGLSALGALLILAVVSGIIGLASLAPIA